MPLPLAPYANAGTGIVRRAARHVARAALMLALAAVAPPGAAAQQPSAPPPCAAAEHRQFDFWVGEWEVRDSAGTVVGRNRITPIHGGCALHEEWRAAGGGTGSSLDTWHAPTRRWHQAWVDGIGTLLQLDGGLDSSGAMVLEGEATARDGRPVRNRITWTPLAGSDVRQRWDLSRDGGATWRTVFDGRYVRRPAS